MTIPPSRITGFAQTVALLARWRAEHGLTANQAEVLLHVYDRGAVSGSTLSSLVAITTASMSRLLARLEQDGWITRRADEQDARRVHVLPTKQLARAIDSLESLRLAVDSSLRSNRSSQAG